MDPLIIPLAALAIPIIVAPTAIVFKYVTRLREIEHIERMKAVELGRFNPGDELWTVPARIHAAIGAGVPIVAMLAALFASQGVGFHEEIWMFSGMVGVAGVICGSVLVAQARSAAAAERPTAKPVYEPDAFDVVGSRG